MLEISGGKATAINPAAVKPARPTARKKIGVRSSFLTLTAEKEKVEYYWLQIAEREARWLDPCESAIPAPFARRFWSKSMNMPKELSRYLHLNPVRAEIVQE